MASKTKRMAFATIFGAVIFISKTVMPSPIDKIVIIIHALLLALGALLLRRLGATYVAFVGGILTALLRTALAPFTFVFALLYGLFVDGFFFVFRVNIEEGSVKINRLVAALAVSSALVGILSYYTTVFLFGLLERNLMLELIILFGGTLSGAVAGYLASAIWNKYLKNIKLYQ